MGSACPSAPSSEASIWSRLGKALWRLLLGTMRSGFYGAVGIGGQKHMEQSGRLPARAGHLLGRRLGVCCGSASFRLQSWLVGPWLQVLGARRSLISKARSVSLGWCPLPGCCSEHARAALSSQGAAEGPCSPRPLPPAFFKIPFLPLLDDHVLPLGDKSWPLGPGLFLFVQRLGLCYGDVPSALPLLPSASSRHRFLACP